MNEINCDRLKITFFEIMKIRNYYLERATLAEKEVTTLKEQLATTSPTPLQATVPKTNGSHIEPTRDQATETRIDRFSPDIKEEKHDVDDDVEQKMEMAATGRRNSNSSRSSPVVHQPGNLEGELAAKEKEIAQLVEDVRRLQASLTALQEAHAQQLQRLEERLDEKKQHIARLEARLDTQRDYDDIKREISMLRALDLGGGERSLERKPELRSPSGAPSLRDHSAERERSAERRDTGVEEWPSTPPPLNNNTTHHNNNGPTPLPLPPPSPFRFEEHRTYRFAEDMGPLPPGALVGRLGDSLIPKGDPMEARLQEMLRYNIDKYANTNLDTLHISRRVRELLSVHNIGQRLFAKYVLGLSQGTVSELLSKPKPWDKLTEKGRDSYRKMHAWACDEAAIMLLKSLIPKKEAAKEQKKRDRGARESKTITVETYASVLTGPNTDTGILPTSTRRSPPENSISEEEDTISFFCGNPLVEVTKGILHLYKENEMKEAEEAKTLCLLSVPGALGAPDLLAFAAACQQDIAHVRVLRDGSPDHYMALFTFRTSAAAREFHETFDGVPYSSLEPGALCHMAWVSRADWGRTGAAPPAHTELPTCPVCLERMDESVAGVLSVQCAHAFHASCLVRWRDARCPVCRCAQTPEPRARAVCFQCERAEEDGDETRENISGVAEGLLDGVDAGTLWICLICGNVGCGRYEGGHAAKHFLASNHTYALQLGSNRVWDYAGDNFVHRLVQNKADGKLVAAEGGFTSEDSACGGEKLDSAQLEFTYILTQQLDSQRMFYEEKMNKMEAEHIAETEKLRFRATEAEATSSKLSEQVSTLTKENKTLERKLNQVTNKLSVLQNELSEERGLAAALASSQAEWQARAKLREENFVKEVTELKEQLRDVMFFVEARGQLQTQAGASREEIADAQVTVAAPPKPRRRRR